MDRVAMIALIAIQAATIAYLYRASNRDRAEKEILLSRIERHEAQEDAALVVRGSTAYPRAPANNAQDHAASLLRAHTDMDRVLESMFGAPGYRDEMFIPDSSLTQIDRLHAQAIRMIENSFEDFRLAERAMRPGSQMGYLVISPAMDLREFDDCYLLAISLPHATRPELSVVLDGQVLCVSGRQSGRRDGTWRFDKRVQLPGPVSAQAVRATLTNGILRIVAPKGADAAPAEQPSRIM